MQKMRPQVPTQAPQLSAQSSSAGQPCATHDGGNELIAMGAYHYAGSVVQRRMASIGDASGSAEASPLGFDGGGLPRSLRRGVENLSGVALDNVKVHYNSAKPAQVQAQAYAQGSEIHLAPGQERHLAHEVWHVVQQRQGRVAPTTQMKQGGTAINDDVQLEHEADVMGNKAAHAEPRADTGGATTDVATSDTLQDGGIVQRKMGFEFEAGRNVFTKNRRRREPLDRKDVAYDGGDFRLEADSGYHLEFVTEPFDNWPELGDAIQRAVDLADFLVAEVDDDTNNVTVGKENNFEENNISMHIADPTFRASPQSTEGVRLGDLEGMITEHLAERGVATAINQNTHNLVNDARVRTHIAAEAAVDRTVLGLIRAIVMYIHRARAHRGRSKDGPKAGFRLMARTDFRSMYQSLSDTQKTQFNAILFGAGNAATADSQNNPISASTGVALDANLFRRGYQDEGSAAAQRAVAGPTLRNWLGSIATVDAGKDILPPPPGYTPHSDLEGDDAKFRYGMGAMGMDDNLALFEMRGYRKVKGKQTKDHWLTFAQAIYDLAAARNDSLEAREQPEAEVEPVDEDIVAEPAGPRAQEMEEEVLPQPAIAELQQQALAMLPHRQVIDLTDDPALPDVREFAGNMAGASWDNPITVEDDEPPIRMDTEEDLERSGYEDISGPIDDSEELY